MQTVSAPTHRARSTSRGGAGRGTGLPGAARSGGNRACFPSGMGAKSTEHSHIGHSASRGRGAKMAPETTTRGLVDDAIASLERWSESDKKRFEKWFGTSSDKSRDMLLDGFQKLKEKFAGNEAKRIPALAARGVSPEEDQTRLGASGPSINT
jgi:hypothetical protein